MEERMLSDEILLGLIKKAGGDVSKVEAEVAAIKDGVSIDSFADVETALSGKADNDIVADAFSAAEAYAEGDYCTYEGGLYKFKTAHEGAWDAADVDQIQIAGELSELKNTLNRPVASWVCVIPDTSLHNGTIGFVPFGATGGTVKKLVSLGTSPMDLNVALRVSQYTGVLFADKTNFGDAAWSNIETYNSMIFVEWSYT